MRKFFLLFCFLFCFTLSAYSFTLSDFDAPDSMQSDPESGSYYVSNVNGDPSVRDGNGYLSKINASGSPVIQRFIGGKPSEPLLHAPKGIAIAGKDLFVTDIDAVKVFDKLGGKQIATVELADKGAKFLNDIVCDSAGFLYVSDTRANKIFKIDPNKNYATVVFKEGAELGGPSGLAINPKTKDLMAVTWTGGQILEIGRKTGRIHILKRGLTTLDGIDYDNDGNLYVSSFEKGEIYKIARFGRGTLTTYLSGLVTPADISYDRKHEELLVPSFKGNTVTTVPNPTKKNT